MSNNFNEKPNFPFTYGDRDIENEKRLSDYIVMAAENKRVQKHMVAVTFAVLTIVMHTQPASAIPPEHGETANEILNQAAQNGAAAGGIPAVPPIGEIRGQVPVPRVSPQCYIPAMPIEQQHLIAAQQSGQLGAMPGVQNGPEPPIFWAPKKPLTDAQRIRATLIFLFSTAGICSQATWNPIAQIMCAAGLGLGSYAIAKKTFLAIFKSLSS